jgi:hypothetical protein
MRSGYELRMINQQAPKSQSMARGMVCDDPCHLAWHVKKILWRDSPHPNATRPLPARPAGESDSAADQIEYMLKSPNLTRAGGAGSPALRVGSSLTAGRIISLLALLIATPVVVFASEPDPSDAAACRYEARRRRAGYPDLVAPYARCGYGPHYAAYYVGGGATFSGGGTSLSGEPRYTHEGTFGMDYAPCYGRVNLAWYHGKKYQGGAGQYEPNRLNNGFPNFFRR